MTGDSPPIPHGNGGLAVEGFELFPWQMAAVDAWRTGGGTDEYRGTLEIFTGGGKTLIALACCEWAARQSPNLRVAIVVPTEALARQWVTAVTDSSNVPPSQIGLLGAGGQDDLRDKTVLVCVLNTAAQRLPELARRADGELMLVIDECHRAGAPTFSRVLDTPARFRLGLSATPDREELDDDGEPLEYDEQLVGQALGPVVFRFGLRDARLAGWLPEFEVHHHGVQLLASEKSEYDKISRQVDDIADQLADHGADASRARSLVGRPGPLGALAGAYVAATSKRKDVLYRATERGRITELLVRDILARRPAARILLFHERVAEASHLYEQLREIAGSAASLEHSRLSTGERMAAMAGFRDGSTRVLVSVKSLVEGIDVPSADVGISVASTSSVRQRIQALGRVLRRTFDGVTKNAEMHVFYVSDTVDELIYAKEDWSDLTGEARNRYWVWPLDSRQAEAKDAPPRTPRPTEEQEWERLGRDVPTEPVPWLGAMPEREYSVDTRATLRTRSGAVIANPQAVPEMVARIRGRPGGRLYVTPLHRLVLVREAGPEGRLMVAGRLEEPFTTRDQGGRSDNKPVEVADLTPGDPFPGGTDASNGEFRVLQKRGGVIERSLSGGVRQFALTEGADPTKIDNARRVLEAWRRVSSSGIKIAVNAEWHAWYLDAGAPRFLAAVPEGFAWPSAPREGG